jgi:selenocysteine lyase/cysteine desulfurase
MQAQQHAHHASQPPAAPHVRCVQWRSARVSAVLTDAEDVDKLIRALTATKALLPEKVTSQEDDEPAD